MKKWYEATCEATHHIVISSRIRLARNLEAYPFPNRGTNVTANKVIEKVKRAILDSDQEGKMGMDLQYMQEVDKQAMMEQHTISPLFATLKRPTHLVLSADEAMSMMVNEEDHIRIQTMTSGMNLEEALIRANKMDNLLEKTLIYAFDQTLGYLTACPTNIGTGLRASYMVHVPALEMTGQLSIILEVVGKFGLTVRGIYGEGTEVLGSIFQISNQVTLGQTEEEIINNLTNVTKQIVEQEMVVRNKLIQEQRTDFEDRIYRAYGILSYARQIEPKEAIRLLSDMTLGIELGIIQTKNKQKINIYEIMTKIQPASMQIMYNKHLTLQEEEEVRANYIRERLPEIIGG